MHNTLVKITIQTKTK